MKVVYLFILYACLFKQKEYLNYYQMRKYLSIPKNKNEIKESLKLENVRYWNKEKKTLSIEVSIHFGIYMDITKDAGSIPTEFFKENMLSSSETRVNCSWQDTI